jgi:Fuc2NAc and GlcNAc transferase
MLDIPNPRSSHTSPTPRGGGLGIAVVMLVGLAFLVWRGIILAPLAIALGGGGFLVAAIGWLDDRRPQPVWIRAVIQLAAASWAVYWLGRLEPGGIPLPGAWSRGAFEVLVIAWCINLYNFMDGIDGLAAGQALVAGAIGAVLLALGGDSGLAAVSAMVAGASAGFLAWNWAPARIFMGDVGSGLLGFLFGTLALASHRTGQLTLVTWALLLGVFIFDATVTLARRILRRERWYAPHRAHAYQRAVQAGWSHSRVTGAALILMLGLGLLAWVVFQWPALTTVILGATVVLLGMLYGWVEQRRPMSD